MWRVLPLCSIERSSSAGQAASAGDTSARTDAAFMSVDYFVVVHRGRARGHALHGWLLSAVRLLADSAHGRPYPASMVTMSISAGFKSR